MRCVYIFAVVLSFLAFVRCEETASVTTAKPPVTTTGTPNVTTEHHTTTAPITTTSMPVPPKPENAPVVNYTIMGKDEKKKDIICLMAEFSAKFELTYNNTKNDLETGYVSLNNDSTVDKAKSRCGVNETVLVIMIDGNPVDTLTMNVEKKDNKYYVTKVELELSEESIKARIPLAPEQPKISASMENQTLFEAPAGKSYICKSADDMKMLKPDKSLFDVKMDVSDVRFDAFRTDGGNSFRDGQLCAKDEEFSDIIPIAVGAALAALVVIVLIAYFIGRRRSRRLAYQSV